MFIHENKIAKKSIHNGRTNKIIFIHEKKNYPLTPSDVLDDQIRLKERIKIEKSLSLLEQNVRSKESSTILEKKERKNLENKIIYSSLSKSCDELPKIIE